MQLLKKKETNENQEAKSNENHGIGGDWISMAE